MELKCDQFNKILQQLILIQIRFYPKHRIEKKSLFVNFFKILFNNTVKIITFRASNRADQ